MPVLFIVIGLAAGVLSGIFGIGGGVVIVTALVAVARMPIHVATGTSLAAMLLPVGILGVNVYWKAGHLDMRAAALIALGIFVGVVFGARYAQTVAPAALQRGFAIFLALMAVRMWVKAA